MTVSLERVLGLELVSISTLFALAVLSQFLTGRIVVRGLLLRRDQSRRASWARVQLLIATLVTAAYIAAAISTAPAGQFPRIPWFWIFLMGASSVLYLAREAYARALPKVR